MIFTQDRIDACADITPHWRAMTGERDARATANLRGGTLITVAVEDGGTLWMDRTGAASMLTDEVVASIEATARGVVQ